MEISTTLFEKVKKIQNILQYIPAGVIKKEFRGKLSQKINKRKFNSKQKVVEFLVTAQSSVNKFVS